MTELELKRLIQERLSHAGLASYLAERQQQCLEMEDGFFVEIVLKDASKLAEAESIIDEMKAQQAEAGVKIDAVVRALWDVEDVRHAGMARAEDGGLRAAKRFQARLRSGSAEQLVEVDLSCGAIEELQRQKAATDPQSMERLVTNFLRLLLSQGGLSYWDPTRYHHQDVGPAAVMYLLHHSPLTAA